MHVGLYSPVWPPGAEANGIVTYVRIVRDELLRQGHRVSLFSGRCEPDDSERIYRVGGSRQAPLWATLRRRMGLARHAAYDFGCDIADAVLKVHSVDPLDVFEMEESFGWCADVARRLRLPLVVKLHGPAFLTLIDPERDTRERRQRVAAEGRALRAAALIVAPSRSTMADTAAQYALDGAGLVSIPNPMAPVADALLWRLARREPEQILFVGRFDYRKGGDAAVQAFARLAAARPYLQLTFVGPDDGLSLKDGRVQHIADYLAVNVAPDIAARVNYLGTRPLQEIQRLRARSAVTVVATRWESFGYVVAEAMMQGCPLVAFDVVGVNELIVHGRSGLLAPLDDIAALSALIARLLDQPQEAAALGAQARVAITEQCGAETVVRQMVELYRRVAVRACSIAPLGRGLG